MLLYVKVARRAEANPLKELRAGWTGCKKNAR